MNTNAVVDLKEKHCETWRDMPESYWLARLMQEVGELGSSLVGDHDDPVEWELMQIAAICLNWLEMRNPQVLPTKRETDRFPARDAFLFRRNRAARIGNHKRQGGGLRPPLARSGQ